MNKDQLHGLLYEMLETEHGGGEIYTTALSCAENDDLKKEWEEYREQTHNHETIVRSLFDEFGLDPDAETPGRHVVRHIGQSLVAAMEMAKQEAPPAAAEIVAGECVVLAETKDHLNWELLRKASDAATGKEAKVLSDACDKAENQEDEHLYHSTGWTRELWLQSLGMEAVLPPPEEVKNVKTAIGAARAKNARDDMT